MIPIHKGPYRGKDADGKPDNRILYVTAASTADDAVTYAEFLDTCTLGGILQMGVGMRSEDVYKRVSFAEFRELVAHELEWQRLRWRRRFWHNHVISADGVSKLVKPITLEYDPDNPPPPVTCAFRDPSSGKPGLTDVVFYQGDKELHRCKDLSEAEILEAFGMVRNKP